MKRKSGWLLFIAIALVVPAVLFSTGHAERFTSNPVKQTQAQLGKGAGLNPALASLATSQKGDQERGDSARKRLDQARANKKANPTKEAALEFDAALQDYNRAVAAQGPQAEAVDGITTDSVPPPFTGQELEGNGTSATANAINVTGQRVEIISGSINGAGDVDFFTFTATAGNKVWILADTGGTQNTGANSRDTDVDVLAADGTTVIETDDDDGTGNGGDVTLETGLASAIGGRTLTAGGTYFINVRGNAGGDIITPYRLLVVVTTSAATAEVEVNGAATTANTIVAAGGATTGLRSGSLTAGDFDYYAVAADAGNTIYFNADADPERDGGTDVVLELRDPSDNLVLTVDSSSTLAGAAEAANFVVPTSGVYYVKVRHSLAGGTGTYNLMVGVAGGADLGITKITGNPTPTNGGAAFSYTLVVTNHGPQAATDVIISDPLPPGIIFHNVSVVLNPTSPGLTCTGPPARTSGTVICNSSNFPAGQVANITIVAQALEDQASGVRTNTATVTSGTPEPSPNVFPNSASVAQSLVVDAPLSITKAGPASICAGDTYTYHLTVLNGGSSTALNATISDPLPANTTFVGLSGTGGFTTGCQFNGGTPGTVSCPAVDLPSGLSTLDITVRLSPAAPSGALGNTATITTAGTGTIAVGSSTTTATVNHCADLEITKDDSPDAVSAGQDINYKITVRNIGPSNIASGEFVVNDTTFPPTGTALKAGTTISAPGFNCNLGVTFPCTANATLPVGATAVINYRVTVNANFNGGQPGGFVANTATVNIAPAVNASDPIATNNSSTTNTPVGPSADLSVTKDALTLSGGIFGASVTAGGNVIAGFGGGNVGRGEIEYTIAYRNSGSGDATNVHIRDVIPGGTLLDPTFLPIGVVVTPVSGPGLTCQILPTLNGYQLDCTPNTGGGVLPAGANGTIQFSVRVPENILEGAVIKNVAAINSEGSGAVPATPDSNGGNNTSNETQNIVRARADLFITKTGPAGVVAGNDITYTLTVTNNGDSDAQDVLVKDTLPPNVSFVSLGAGSDARFACQPDNGNAGIVNCTAATLIAPATNAPPIIPPRIGSNIATIIIIGRVAASVADGTVLTNNAGVLASTQDPIPANNAAAPVNTTVTNENDPDGVFQFSSATASVAENAIPGSIDLTINRTGDTTGISSVYFETSDIGALQKTDYTFNSGTVQFGPGDTSKTINVLIVNDAFVDPAETFRVTLSKASPNFVVGAIGSTAVTITDDDAVLGPNPIDNAGFFVRQQYLDFLGREPDAPGLAFWTAQITACGAVPACIEDRRVNVSGAFFLSIEFQETSGNVIRTQRVAFSRQSVDPLTRISYLPFMRDTRQVGKGVIIGQPGADLLLEQNKQAYAQQIVTSAEFIARFPVAPAAIYVDSLYASAGVTPTAAERNAAISAFGAGGTPGRVAALRSVVDSDSLRVAEFRTSFVLAEYFGYLRRNPTDAPDFSNAGYQFWLDKLNLFNGNFQQAEMVKAFIASIEYRGRFGTP
jgi:uncharacterized repeat protein (TIGR01451 family)